MQFTIGFKKFPGRAAVEKFLNCSLESLIKAKIEIKETRNSVRIVIPPNGLIISYKDKSNEVRWFALSPTGNKLADSGEGYKRGGGSYKGMNATNDVLNHGQRISVK